MKEIYNFLAILLALFFLNCETNAEVNELLDTPQLTVINGYISPQDETLKVQVSKSKPRANAGSISPNDLVIKNASVDIKDEQGNIVNLQYNNETFNYEANSSLLSIEAGKQYFLTVVLDQEAYNASCVVPTFIVSNIEEEFTKRIPSASDTILNVKFNDQANSSNFYIIGAEIGSINEPVEGVVDFEANQFMVDQSINSNGIINAEGFFFPGRFDSNRMTIKVAHVDALIYDSFRTNFLNEYNSEDPLSEVIIGPSNIEGKNGYGVFAGYQLSEKEVTF